ncbi:ribulose-phosphate 3-epimerase [Clostridia bacterium]|nr:ribulose-phosphate 3-epimerase [Clostridia bacterium]
MTIAPSILAADLYDLKTSVESLKAVGLSVLHVDIMDGRFVPNITFGTPMVKALRNRGFALDVHLMVERPEECADAFVSAGADYLTVHSEAVPAGQLPKLLAHIRRQGARPGLSIRPKTAVQDIAPFLPLCDQLLIMTVPPGAGGQPYGQHSDQRIATARRLIDQVNPDCILEVDGGINAETINRAYDAGARRFVCGTSVFGASDPAEAFARLSKQRP